MVTNGQNGFVLRCSWFGLVSISVD